MAGTRRSGAGATVDISQPMELDGWTDGVEAGRCDFRKRMTVWNRETFDRVAPCCPITALHIFRGGDYVNQIGARFVALHSLCIPKTGEFNPTEIMRSADNGPKSDKRFPGGYRLWTQWNERFRADCSKRAGSPDDGSWQAGR